VRISSLWLRAGGIALAGAVAAACATNASADGPPVSRHSHRTAVTSVGAAGAAGGGAAVAAGSTATGPVQAASVAALSARQLAGQRVIYSYKGQNPPASLLTLIRHGEAAGVVFFGGNITSKTQIAAVIRKLEAANAATTNPVRTPLLLMTDQEGGLIRRLPGAPLRSEKQIGEAAQPGAAATMAGQNAALNLRSVGMNVNLAPVLDVYRTPGDFDDQNQRSYSKNPHTVSALGSDFINAQQKGGVAATAKHFPGLGAATKSQNTDKAPVTLHVTKAALRATDELPYKAAIADKSRLVMVSWAVYPAIDATRPAGLSSKIVQGELRSRLGFGGVTVTDALEAGALRAYGSTQNRALLAAKAGMDLLLCSGQNVAEGVQCMDGLESGYNSGSLPHPAFKAADQRVMSLRASLQP
jgi:beta-N-acetylhexosaminidase